ncbi:type III-B CRISPR module RAMP protein Cmr1 [Vandammella animalimorsus]|uniref:Type III-B CRISPR module RAMP protein Cmr1 n=1 Tax=Vandammella animalimorsus TaxID=2029117 RepID=A0A2A2AFU2_9BURK|nr:type III-B CRISPR module RAMP protein Cmr1 [Vandammella animalimorsus]PAT36459.1 type III-B CRISPR module RAMP protein Cmr1 [Vandammella animalimorsus]
MLTLTQPPQTTIDYRITTPMFLGGAEPQEVDATQFRNASFKGALRFWWRALLWGRFLREAQGDVTQALKNLHHKEGTLFGKASDGNDSRQSAVRVQSTLSGQPCNKKDLDTQLEGIGYLLGLGLYHFRDKVLRDYLPPSQLQVTLQYACELSSDDISGIEHAAIALGLFGGLGSRSRKGLGSLSIQYLQPTQGDKQEFETRDAIEAFVNNTLDFSAPATPLPPFTAFSQASRIDISGEGSDAIKTLKVIGDEMQLYRGYGRHNPKTGQHEVLGQRARQNFKDDHDLVQGASSLKELPKRAVFGLPHNYFFSSTGHKMDIAPENGGRRASPLFIHVHALKDSRFVALQLLLPALYLHKDMAIEAKPGKGRAQTIPNPITDYAVIHRYMDGFKTKLETKANYKELRRHG